MRERSTQDREYDTSFKAFLAATNEKDVIAAALADSIQPGSAILDIGAGDGTMTQKLRDTLRPSTYTAVETNGAFCDALASRGIPTVRGTYPDVDSLLGGAHYDNVLSIYSAPLERPNRIHFLHRAFARTAARGGAMSVVSFGTVDPWTEMIAEIAHSLPPMPADSDMHATIGDDYPARIQNDCSLFGETTTRLITSEITTNSPEELFDAVAFTATGGLRTMLEQYAASKGRILNIIERHAPSGVLTQSHSLTTTTHGGEND